VRRTLIKISDRILVYVLTVIVAVLSVVVIDGNRDARDAARAAEMAARQAGEAAGFANILRDCRTPGTECHTYQQENGKKEQAFFIKLVTDASLCNLLSDIRFVPTADPVAIEILYNECITARTPPPPDAPPTPPPPPKRPLDD
jgi:hypothetical protein